MQQQQGGGQPRLAVPEALYQHVQMHKQKHLLLCVHASLRATVQVQQESFKARLAPIPRRPSCSGVSLCIQVSAVNKVKSTLGVGKQDKYSYGGGTFPNGVITVNVPNYQQRQQPRPKAPLLHSADPLPNLPTPFAAAQLPLPDQNSAIDSLASPAAAEGLTQGLGLSPAVQKALAPRGASVSPNIQGGAGQPATIRGSGRLGSAPATAGPKMHSLALPSVATLTTAGNLRRHRSTPHLGKAVH